MKLKLNNNTIIITNDIEKTKNDIIQVLDKQIVKIFLRDDFLIEDAKMVIKEAYISEEKKKYLIIGAKTFRTETQNSLLKILEESPKNIIFLLISQSKSNFLPTIRSRLPILFVKEKKQREKIDIDLAKMTLKDIFEYTKKYQRISKSELKDMIQNIFYSAIFEYKIYFDQQEITIFENALQLAELNTRGNFLLNSILLTIFNKKNRKKNENNKIIKQNR